MPLLDRGEIFGRGDPDQEKSASEIGHERDRERSGDERDPARNRQAFQFAKEEPDHERGLERAHSAARFAHADDAVVYADEAALELRRDPEKGQRFRGDRGHDPHQPLHQRGLDRRHPRHRDEDEADRKRKMPHRLPAAPITNNQ